MSENLNEQESQDKSERLLREYNERQWERKPGWNPFQAPEEFRTYGRRLARKLLEESSKKRVQVRTESNQLKLS